MRDFAREPNRKGERREPRGGGGGPTPFRGFTACERNFDINNLTSWRLPPLTPPTGAKFFLSGLRGGGPPGGGAHFAFLEDVPGETPKSRCKFGL